MRFVANFIRVSAVQKFRKSVKIWHSYRQLKSGNFFETQCNFSSSQSSVYLCCRQCFVTVEKIQWDEVCVTYSSTLPTSTPHVRVIVLMSTCEIVHKHSTTSTQLHESQSFAELQLSKTVQVQHQWQVSDGQCLAYQHKNKVTDACVFKRHQTALITVKLGQLQCKLVRLDFLFPAAVSTGVGIGEIWRIDTPTCKSGRIISPTSGWTTRKNYSIVQQEKPSKARKIQETVGQLWNPTALPLTL